MPEKDIYPIEATNKKEDVNVSNSIFGNRFHKDQTVYEYLIEFLLIFVSAKISKESDEGKFSFHNSDLTEMSFYADPRIGLKRFIFYDKSKKSGSIYADKVAFNDLIEQLSKRITIESYGNDEKKDIINYLQDFLFGYAVILKNRSWCAQAMLPICPELIFCEAMPAEKHRKAKVDYDSTPESVDTEFDFKQHNFLARGGELYYLHLVQGLKNNSEKKKKLEFLLKDLLTAQSEKVSSIANFIQNTWYSVLNTDEKQLREEYSLGFIPNNGYVNVEGFSIDELLNFLSNKLPIVRKLDLLSQGIILQVMRMMTERISNYLGINKKPWIVDMCCPGNKIVKIMSCNSFQEIENDFTTALNKEIEKRSNKNEAEKYSILLEGKKESLGIFRSKGKDIKCIIPIKGGFERFSLSEDIVTFLVLSILKPKTQMTLDMFLSHIYENYGIVIGINEYIKSAKQSTEDIKSISISFNRNVAAFENFLKATGFLQELSDATSVVINPYEEITFTEEQI